MFPPTAHISDEGWKVVKKTTPLNTASGSVITLSCRLVELGWSRFIYYPEYTESKVVDGLVVWSFKLDSVIEVEQELSSAFAEE